MHWAIAAFSRKPAFSTLPGSSGFLNQATGYAGGHDFMGSFFVLGMNHKCILLRVLFYLSVGSILSRRC